jgi:SAM-dependent methyltransferase
VPAGKLGLPFPHTISILAFNPYLPHELTIMDPSKSILERHWNRVRQHYQQTPPLPAMSRGYRTILGRYLDRYIPKGVRLLEIGCGTGDLLATLTGRDRRGIDLVPEQVEEAARRYPECKFSQGAAEEVAVDEAFDYILLSDILNEAADVQAVLKNVREMAGAETRLVVNVYNTLWRPVLALASLLGLKPRRPELNWLSRSDLLNLLDLSGWEVIRHETRMLVPHDMFGLGRLVNCVLAPFLPWFCLSLFFVARVKPAPATRQDLSVSVIIPARNEAGNIRAAIERTPDMGSAMEILFVEGHSQDETWQTIQAVMEEFPDKTIRAFQQTGKGKGDAMRLGYKEAKGDVLMILDADLTVPPEDLPKFYDAVASGKAEFANGVRLVYPMEDEAMRFLNMCGNKFFSLLFSWLLNQTIKDTLCGTKVFSREHYQLIEANRAYFGDFDPFGDFDLIFGASRLNLRIMDIPIRYQNRSYGSPQIDRWRDGALLIRMSWFAARKLKFLG